MSKREKEAVNHLKLNNSAFLGLSDRSKIRECVFLSGCFSFCSIKMKVPAFNSQEMQKKKRAPRVNVI